MPAAAAAATLTQIDGAITKAIMASESTARTVAARRMDASRRTGRSEPRTLPAPRAAMIDAGPVGGLAERPGDGGPKHQDRVGGDGNRGHHE